MKKAIYTQKAPAPVGPYSQAVKTGPLLFISGQIAIDPSSGQLIIHNIEEETHRVMKNIGAILSASNMNYDHVVKCSIFVADINQYERINEVYAGYFTGDHPPARELVEVAKLPKGVNVEISVIATENL